MGTANTEMNEGSEGRRVRGSEVWRVEGNEGPRVRGFKGETRVGSLEGWRGADGYLLNLQPSNS